jgi:hypothetical protein
VPRRRKPTGTFIVKHVQATANGKAVDRQVWLLAKENGELGAELKFGALNDSTWRYCVDRIGEAIEMEMRAPKVPK